MARNRVIYQSEALFVSPNATGAHFSATAVVTGMGNVSEFIGGGLGQKGGPKGESGNALGYLSLVNPVGLHEDPKSTLAITKDYDTTKINNLRGSAIEDREPATSDLINISGEAFRSIIADLQPKIGFEALEGSAPKLNDAATITAAQTALKTMDTGKLWFFTRESHWNNAVSGYFAEIGDGDSGDTATHGGNAVAGPLVGGKQRKPDCPFCVYLQPYAGSYENLVQQIHRVQSANYSFTINRTDVNTFGQLARIDAIALEPPTVNLDFTYYPTDGFNERNLGLYVQGASDDLGKGMGKAVKNSASDHLKADNAGKNFFILTTPESTDAFNSTDPIQDRSVIGLGNGFLSDYSIEAAVGSIPSASTTIELYNAKSDIGTTGVSIPGINLQKGSPVTGINFTLGDPKALRGDDGGASPSTGQFGASSITALRPGDIQLEIPQELSMISKVSGDGSIHIQNFNLSMPLSRSPIDRLGTRFAFSRVVDLPVTASLSVSALMSDVGTGNLARLIDDCKEHDVKIKLYGQTSCEPGAEKVEALTIDFKGARIDSESISSDIGSNKSIDLSFTTQIGGPEDLIHGVFISGANRNIIPEAAQIPGR